MIQSEKLRFAKNAFANVVNGASSSVFAIILPYFFVRYFTHQEFGLWVLILQLAAYVNYLNFGFQVAIGRYVAHSLERGDCKHAERVLAAGLQSLTALAAVGFAIILSLAAAFPYIFRGVNSELISTARITLIGIGAAIAMGLPFSAFLGVFVGLQRNEIPAYISALGKGMVALLTVVTAVGTRNLTIVGLMYAVATCLQYPAQYFIFRFLCETWHVEIMKICRPIIKELVSYCLGLSVWSSATLVVSGMDTTIVGIVAFRTLAAYGSALILVNIFVGAVFAIIGPLVQVFAKQHAAGRMQDLYRNLNTSSFYCALLLLVSGAWMVLLAPPFFRLWVGPLAPDAIPIFMVLLAANVIRNSSLPYMSYLVAAGEQGKVVLTPIIEAIINLIVSVVLGLKVGAIGVALGTLAGGLIGTTVNFIYNMPRTLTGREGATLLFRSSVLHPTAFCLPLLAVLVTRYVFAISLPVAISAAAAATLLSIVAVWKYRLGFLSQCF